MPSLCALCLGEGFSAFLSCLLARGARPWNQTASCEKREELLFMLFFFSLNSVDFFFFCRLLQAVSLCLGEGLTAYLSYLLARRARLATNLRCAKEKKRFFVLFFSWFRGFLFSCRLSQAVLFRFA
uniref:Uncharacterized protein n=1 Tax=Ixodes ricinus TaxID=34613 RepID=A0A147BSX5_IXORI